MKKILTISFIAIIILGGFTLVKTIQENLKEQEYQEIENYKKCILEQDQKHSWIVRSSCSNNYKELDKKANLVYEQKGLNIYLKK